MDFLSGGRFDKKGSVEVALGRSKGTFREFKYSLDIYGKQGQTPKLNF